MGRGGSSLLSSMKGATSMRMQAAKLKRSDIPSDLGLIPGTFIRPKSSDLPRLFSKQWSRRLRLESISLFQAPMDFLRFQYLHRWAARKDPLTGKRPKVPFLLAERYYIARDLHRRLYQAIASGDRETIQKIACSGLNQQLMIKLDHRKAANLPKEDIKIEYRGRVSKSFPTRIYHWFLEAFTPPPLKAVRIVADRTAQLPVGKDGKIRQIVAEIKSRQTLNKKDGSSPKTMDKTEYVVIQQMTVEGQQDDWMIWGTTEPSTPEQVDKILNAAAQQGGFIDRMRGILYASGGSQQAQQAQQQ